MTGKLIDAEKLKKHYAWWEDDERRTLFDQIVDAQPTIDAVPLDGSFLKMSKGDYLIYKRHWLYEHFDMEMEIQRSAMKFMGYEPALKDAEPHWIPCNERLPEDDRSKVVTLANGNAEVGYYSNGDWWCVGDKVTLENQTVIAWMPLPEPYEVEDERN